MKKEHRKAFVRAIGEGRAPDFTTAELVNWIEVADDMIVRGELEVATQAVHYIREQWPSLAWGRNVEELIARIPPPDPEAPPFADKPAKTLYAIARHGADTAVLVFCAADDRAGMPLPMLHRWLSRSPASVIYLRDPLRLGYLGGVPQAGPDLDASLVRLKALIQELGARRVVCYGNSMGGFGALLYGIELGADAVLSMGGLVNLRSRFNAGLHYVEAAKRIEAAFPDAPLDLREHYLSAKSPPATWIAYAEHNWDDRIHAEHMLGLEGVTLTRIDSSKSHSVAAELIRIGKFEDLLRQALAG
ncbi:MAG TPA: hypothetical protein VIJ94_19030 [Caulobacteraceae bacterium]